MKNFSKEDLVERSKQIFERKPELSEILATEDGQFFLNDENGRSVVSDHCKDNAMKSHLITRIEAETFTPGKKVKQESPAADPGETEQVEPQTEEVAAAPKKAAKKAGK